jgi:uncharacterized phiE125 gp8 family phage protein
MIDLAAAKEHLRVDTDAEDSSIAIYLASAKAAVESATGKLLSQRIVAQSLAGFPCDPQRAAIRLWYGPVSGDVVAITYDDSDGIEQALADFRLVEGSTAKLLPAYGALWPSAQYADGSVRITYTAGYADEDVPGDLDQAVLMLVGHYYLNREAVNSGTSAGAVELPLGVEALVAPYRPVGIG